MNSIQASRDDQKIKRFGLPAEHTNNMRAELLSLQIRSPNVQRNFCMRLVLVLISLLFIEPQTARAQFNAPDLPTSDKPLTAEKIRKYGQDLSSSDSNIREAALIALSNLGAGSLGAIDKRIEVYAKVPLQTRIARAHLVQIRRRSNSFHGTDSVNRIAGLSEYLKEQRGTDMRRLGERIAVLEALHRQETVNSGRRIVRLTSHNHLLWAPERRRISSAWGAKIIPVAIEARRIQDKKIRFWAQRTLNALNVHSPGDAVQLVEESEVGSTLLAYASVRDMNAMEVIVGFIDHPKTILRNAARSAITEYGRNAVWQYRKALKHRAPNREFRNWDWERIRDTLFALIDEERLAPIDEDLKAGMQAYQQGEFLEMQSRFDRVLSIAPALSKASAMAPGYAALGERLYSERKWLGAAWAFKRALALAPDHAVAYRWNARLILLEAKQTLHEGIVDLTSFERAYELDNSLAEAQHAVSLFSEESAKGQASRQKIAGFVSASLLFLCGLGLLTWKSRTAKNKLHCAVLNKDDSAFGLNPYETKTEPPLKPVEDVEAMFDTLPG